MVFSTNGRYETGYMRGHEVVVAERLVPNRVKAKFQQEHIREAIALAQAVKNAEYGTQEEIDASNAFVKFVNKLGFDPEQHNKFWWLMKATTVEFVDMTMEILFDENYL